MAWEDRLVLAITFLTFKTISVVDDYPVPTAGYDASAIVGFILALAASTSRTAIPN